MSDANGHRSQALGRLANEAFDVLVIGGGITGAGIARDAQARGYRTALIEKDDWASGTSSKSSKLVHGGLRYLEYGELKLVFESVNERALLMRLSRHLVRPLPFLVSRYQGDERYLATMALGLHIYEALCFWRAYKNHKTYGAKRTLELEPALRKDGLSGGIVYYDCLTDDARVTLENVLDARALGAAAANHLRAVALLKQGDRVVGATVEDAETKAQFPITARVVINASGPWTDEVTALLGQKSLLKPTKGIHLVVDDKRLPLHHALMMRSPSDRRAVFAIPWGLGRTVIGTTDTFFDGTPDQVEPTAQDVSYLLETANHYAPEANLTPDDVLSTWSGLRPLLKPESADTGASAMSREHVILEQPGFVTIAGGKLTTYRRMAVEVVDRALAQLGDYVASPTKTRPLPGSRGLEDSDDALFALEAELARAGLTNEASATLANLYGVRARTLAAEVAKGGAPAERVDDELPWHLAQVDEAVTTEDARTLDDVLSRRVPLLLRARDQGLGVAPRVAARMAQLLAWDGARTAKELADYQAVVASSRAWQR